MNPTALVYLIGIPAGIGAIAVLWRHSTRALSRIALLLSIGGTSVGVFYVALESIASGYYSEPFVILVPPLVLSIPIGVSRFTVRRPAIALMAIVGLYWAGALVAIVIAFECGYVDI